MINALLGETVLPTSDTTCTNKIYKIKHHKSNITLDGFNNKDKIIYHEVFDNLDNLGKRIFELSSSKNKLWSEISTVELQMDISHLYPDGFEDSFNLTIIDTPGTNSGEGNDEGQLKTHINITMDAIVEFEKNMVILVVDGQDYQDESIRSLLDQIDHANGLEKGIYNDRFLFVMNKCDNKNYQGDETLAKVISEYANYIKSDGRKNIKERMISPRIFPMAALPALAIRKSHINECCIDSVESQNLFYSYESFKKTM